MFDLHVVRVTLRIVRYGSEESPLHDVRDYTVKTSVGVPVDEHKIRAYFEAKTDPYSIYYTVTSIIVNDLIDLS